MKMSGMSSSRDIMSSRLLKVSGQLHAHHNVSNGSGKGFPSYDSLAVGAASLPRFRRFCLSSAFICVYLRITSLIILLFFLGLTSDAFAHLRVGFDVAHAVVVHNAQIATAECIGHCEWDFGFGFDDAGAHFFNAG